MSVPAVKLPPPGQATLADLLALPEEGRGYEVIEGAIVEKQTSAEHGVAQSRIGRVLGPFDRRPGGRLPGGWWFATEVLVDFGPDQKLRPDVVGWRRERLPDTRRSITHKFNVAGHEGYITVGLYDDGRPGELFITMAKEGSTIGGLMDCFGTAVSMSLQYGVPLEDYVRKFSHMRFEPQGYTKNPDIKIAKSLIDYIFRWLGITFLPGYKEASMGVLPAAEASADAATDDDAAPSVGAGVKDRVQGSGFGIQGQNIKPRPPVAEKPGPKSETGKRQPEAIALYEKNGYNRTPNYGQYVGVENSVCFEKVLDN